jgi:molybdenum cofactor biosynthesis enzyme
MPGYVDVYEEKNTKREEEEVEEAIAAAKLNISSETTQNLLESIAADRTQNATKLTAPARIRPTIKLRVEALMQTWVISYSNAAFKTVYDICHNIENEVKIRRIFPPRPKLPKDAAPPTQKKEEEEPLQVWFYCDENNPTYQMSITFTRDPTPAAAGAIYYASHCFEDRQ